MNLCFLYIFFIVYGASCSYFEFQWNFVLSLLCLFVIVDLLWVCICVINATSNFWRISINCSRNYCSGRSFCSNVYFTQVFNIIYQYAYRASTSNKNSSWHWPIFTKLLYLILSSNHWELTLGLIFNATAHALMIMSLKEILVSEVDACSFSFFNISIEDLPFDNFENY